MKRLKYTILVSCVLFITGCFNIPIINPPTITRIYDGTGALIVESEEGDIQIAEGWAHYRIYSNVGEEWIWIVYDSDSDGIIIKNEKGEDIGRIQVDGKIVEDILKQLH